MLHDLATSFRRAVRTPLFSLTLVGILGVGIGATTTMVSVLDTLLWRPVAMPEPNELVAVTTVRPDGARRRLPLASAEGIMRAGLPVDAWCAYDDTRFATRFDGRMMPASGALMSAGCVDVMRVAPVMGRWFTGAEAPVTGRGQALAVITDRYWRRMFSSAPDVLGRTVSLDEGTVTVIGVLPASFSGFEKDLATDIITPFGVFRAPTAASSLVGRRRPHISLDALRGRMTAIWPDIIKGTAASAPNPTEAAQLQVQVQSAAAGFSLFRRLYAPSLRSVTTLAVLLLLLTCINASGLLATKVASHRDEILVMRSLGASGWRIVRQMLAEAFILACLACGVGVVMAYGWTRAFRALLPWGNMPWTIEFSPDIRILAAVAGACLAVTLLIAIVPAWLATRAESVVQGSRTVTRSASRWSDAMLMGQLAATVVLVFACGLLVRSFTSLAHVNRGFDHERLLSVRLLPAPGGHQNLNQQEYYPQLLQKFAALPGVESVGFARYFGTIPAQLPPQPLALVSSTPVNAAGAMEYVSPNFFATVGVPIVRGRDVAWTDLPDTTTVALVSESLARDLDANGDVVGRSIEFGSNAQRQRLQIIGIVGNISLGNYRQNAVKLVFVPALQANEATYPTFHLRATGDPLALVGPVTEIVEATGREYVQRAEHVDEMFSNGLIAERMAAVVSIGAATLGVVLAALGLYALLTHSVAMRRREIGIRMAVGAAPRSVRALMVRHMLVLVLGGLVVGVPAALMGSAVLHSLLFGLSTTDRVTLAVAVAIVVVVGAAASVVPAVRAGRVDPAQLLRAE
jgi:putative ABC transport system permease protein